MHARLLYRLFGTAATVATAKLMTNEMAELEKRQRYEDSMQAQGYAKHTPQQVLEPLPSITGGIYRSRSYRDSHTTWRKPGTTSLPYDPAYTAPTFRK